MIRLLLGGSPCTKWSIAQSKDRETKPEGIGWELFKNFLIAKEKFKPDFFLYENNKSAAQPIKDQISRELEVPLQYINSALVSAQNRQRFYAHNIVDVSQPEDRGLLLRDVLESGCSEKGYTLAEPVHGNAKYLLKNFKTNDQKSVTLTASCYKGIGSDGMITVAEPVNVTADGKAQCLRATYYKDGIRNLVGNTVDRKTCVAEPVRIGTIENTAKSRQHDSQQYRVYSPDGKSVTLCGQGGGMGAKTGLYAVPAYEYLDYTPRKNSHIKINENAIRCAQDKNGASVAESFVNFTDRKIGTITTAHVPKCIEPAELHHNGKTYPVYTVQNGQITIKGKQYPIKLSDGYYIIRKLTPIECERLQTLPDNYTAGVSNTQRYKALGNGWTAEVIIHILRHANIPLDAEIEVLSMYDGIATGRYCLDAMGYRNIRYHSYENDKYPIIVAQKNYPDIIQYGDAFQVREDGWQI